MNKDISKAIIDRLGLRRVNQLKIEMLTTNKE